MLGSNPSADSVASTDVGGCCGIPRSSADCESANHRERQSSVKSRGRGGKAPADCASRQLPAQARAPSHNALMNRGLAAEPRFISVLSLVFSNVSDFP